MTTVIDTNETLYARVLGDSSRVESSGLDWKGIDSNAY
jgi:hypothetical protein